MTELTLLEVAHKLELNENGKDMRDLVKVISDDKNSSIQGHTWMIPESSLETIRNNLYSNVQEEELDIIEIAHKLKLYERGHSLRDLVKVLNENTSEREGHTLKVHSSVLSLLADKFVTSKVKASIERKESKPQIEETLNFLDYAHTYDIYSSNTTLSDLLHQVKVSPSMMTRVDGHTLVIEQQFISDMKPTANDIATKTFDDRLSQAELELLEKEVQARKNRKLLSNCYTIDFINTEVKELIKAKWLLGKEEYLKTYGGVLGTLYLGEDLAQRLGVNDAKLDELYLSLKSPDVLKEELGVNLVEIEPHIEVKKSLNNLRNMKFLMNYLGIKYHENKELFFERYGSKVGIDNVLEDISTRFPLGLRFMSLNNFLIHGEALTEYLSIEDNRFKREWKVREVGTTSHKKVEIVNFLKSKFAEDEDFFFKRYGQRIGNYFLAKDLFEETKFTIYLLALRSFNKPEVIQHYLDIFSPRFNLEWKPNTLLTNFHTTETIIDFLKRKYDSNPDTFFEKYGSKYGFLLTLNEVKNDEQAITFFNSLNYGMNKDFNPTLTKISGVFKNGEDVAKMIEREDARFETDWKVKSSQIDESDLEIMTKHLKEIYDEDNGSFLERFNKKLGAFHFVKNVFEKSGEYLNLQNISSFFKDGAFIATVLNSKDKAFFNNWKTNKLYLNLERFKNTKFCNCCLF